MAAARWARLHELPAILMSESQAIDRPHVWWKELIKQRRLHWFDAALVGGPTHRDYLVQLGMPPAGSRWATTQSTTTFSPRTPACGDSTRTAASGLPSAPYFLTVCRFVPEKNLVRLITGFARYRAQCDPRTAWDLVLCGDGPLASQIEQAVAESRCSQAIHRPGFLQSDDYRSGTLMPVLLCSRVCPSRGGSLSTKPPQAACRFWSPHALAAHLCSCHSPTARPEVNSIRSTSTQLRRTRLDGRAYRSRSPRNGRRSGRDRFPLGPRPLRSRCPRSA